MERAFLESFGLEKEQIDKILDQASKDIGAKVTELSTLQSKLDAQEERLKTANTTIDNLKKANTDNESLVSEIEKYKKQVKDQEAQFKETLVKNSALMELQSAGAINPELAVHLLDLSLGSVDKDGKVIGISEQVEKIKNDTTQSYLFNTQTTDRPAEPTQPQQDTQNNQSVDRGGYSPQSGDTATEGTSWGARAAQNMKNGQAATNTDDFWASFGKM